MNSSSASTSLFFEVDISTLCRICGVAAKILIPIFGDEETDLERKIEAYLPIKVSRDDMLPLKLCVPCTHSILNWHEIYENCLETDRRFQEMLLASQQMYAKELDAEEAAKMEAEVATKEGTSGGVGEGGGGEEKVEISVSAAPSSKAEEEAAASAAVAAGNNNNSFTCTFCPRTVGFAQRAELDEHFRNLHAEKVFHCDVCGHLWDRNDLMSHMLSHALESVNGASPSCDETGAKSTGTNGLMPPPSPKRSRTGGGTTDPETESGVAAASFKLPMIQRRRRTHTCSECEERFESKAQLSKHTRLQHGECYKCNTCLKIFKGYSSLLHHKAIHGEPKFFCHICGRRFFYKFDLTKHGTTEHGRAEQKIVEKHEMEFSCSLCEYKAMQRRHLLHHVKNEHREERCFV